VPRILRLTAPGLLLLAAVAAVLVGLAIGGGAAARPIADPGDVVRFGLPILKMVVNLSIAVVIGSLALALWAFSSDERAYRRAIDLAAGSAVVLTIAAGATLIFTFLDVSQTPLSADASFGTGLAFFATEVGLGQAWLWITLLAAAAAVMCFAVTNQTALFFVGLLALSPLLPMALIGHAAGATSHDIAMTSLGLHLVFVAVWLGGLVALVVLRRSVTAERLVTITQRYSTLALVSLIVVVASGVVNAIIRVGSWDQLFTPYGELVALKVGALVVLVIFGAIQRLVLIRGMAAGRARAFALFTGIELVIMGVASGLAAALARTPSPIPDTPPATPTPAEILTGEKLPPEPHFVDYFTMWHIDLIWLLVCAFGIFFYIAGVIRLKRRGDAWPVYRTVLWVLGLLMLAYITNGGVNVYERYLFSAHMFVHMALGMMVPILLVPGAPITLAMRAIRKRDDLSRGAREWIFIAVHSRFASVISHPVFATVNFVGSLWLFYYTPIFRWATTDHIGHEWMIVHFLLAGYLFVQSLIGIDPGVKRFPYPGRVGQLLITMTVHAFFGLSLMSSTGLFLADWYGAMGRTWGPTPMEDQYLGGSIAWSVGEIPNLVLMLVIAVQWSRSEERLTKRRDRNADRTGDAELEAYNAMLAQTAARDSKPTE
jgi:cytochrome c oxidase assembly factor CtaG/putative copper export protein